MLGDGQLGRLRPSEVYTRTKGFARQIATGCKWCALGAASPCYRTQPDRRSCSLPLVRDGARSPKTRSYPTTAYVLLLVLGFLVRPNFGAVHSYHFYISD